MSDHVDGATIFVVDDDDEDRESLRGLLESYGFVVEAFASGEAFLQGNHSQSRGCLLLDVRLPDMSGLEVQRRLTADRVRMPTIMITAYGDVAIAVAAMKAGAVDFIEKPFPAEVLLGSLRAVLATGTDAARPTEGAGGLEERVALLTPREREVMNRLIVGQPNKVIAGALGISPRTVEVHRARVMEKMQARNLAQLVRMAISIGEA